MKTIFDDCKQCDTADEKVNYLAGFVVKRLLTPRDDFYLQPHYDSAETMKYLKIGKKTLNNLCSSREIEFRKPKGKRYFKREVLEAYVNRNRHRSKYKDLLDHYDLY
mgnify:FL=1